MKSGTTTLCHWLDQHSDIFMSDPKEPNFFCRPDIYARGFEWYETLFQNAQGETAIGEGSTSYTKAHIFDGVPQRIARHLPNARLIYIVRHPLERIESHWMFNVIHYDLRQSFSKALRDKHSKQIMINTSKYWWQISKFREHFSDEQILVLFFEEMKQNPDATLRRCFDFLGVSTQDYSVNTDQKRNVTPEFEMESNTLSVVRKIPAYRRLKNFVPSGLKTILQPLLKQQIAAHPQWNPRLKRQIARELEPDTHQFLDYCNKPRDYWDLAE